MVEQLETENEKLVQIMVAANQMFMRYGLKSVTMDDMARELGMSKKTLYVFFRDKNDLIIRTTKYFLERHNRKVDEIYSKKLNAIDESFEIFKMVTTDLREIKPTVFFDLKKYHPEAWKIYEQHRTSAIPALCEENLKHGIEQGLYREDMNTRIISLAYCTMINSIFETDYYSPNEFDFKSVYVHIFNYHIHGISSERGLKYLHEKMKSLTSGL